MLSLAYHNADFFRIPGSTHNRAIKLCREPISSNNIVLTAFLTKVRRTSIFNARRNTRPLPQVPVCRTLTVVGSSESRERRLERDGVFRPSKREEQEQHEHGYGLRDGRSRVSRNVCMYGIYIQTVVCKTGVFNDKFPWCPLGSHSYLIPRVLFVRFRD